MHTHSQMHTHGEAIKLKDESGKCIKFLKIRTLIVILDQTNARGLGLLDKLKLLLAFSKQIPVQSK